MPNKIREKLKIPVKVKIKEKLNQRSEEEISTHIEIIQPSKSSNNNNYDFFATENFVEKSDNLRMPRGETVYLVHNRKVLYF